VITARVSPLATEAPTEIGNSATVPALWAVISFSIFIASMTAISAPSSTVAPFSTSTLSTVPWIGEVSASAPLFYEGWDDALAGDIFGRILIWFGLSAVTMLFVARVRSQRTGLRRAGDEASRLARVDVLTGLGNRRAFDEALAASVARSTRTGTPLTVIVADLDGFKAINDRFGHVEGDACLKGVASALSRSLRSPESCFRWGGDEFSILVDGDHEAAEALSARVAAVVGEDCVDPEGNPITMRFGAASLADHADPTELVTAADLDLIAAKAT